MVIESNWGTPLSPTALGDGLKVSDYLTALDLLDI